MTKPSFFSWIIIIGLIAGAIGYTAGIRTGIDQGTKKANAKAQSRIDEATKGADQAWSSYADLSRDYGKLSDKYDTLYNAAKAYVSITPYETRQPVTCNSYTYGMNNLSTTCY
ncbi:hypothetical protein RAAC3_TM7C00001G0225 [Candidatus Saccharibacteria bacterium RAAC3_TM7_1]|nr:hypothetical protein RAAC3_TM7C00001G0225 [Candidatus Saccharibacteria bacterium RAAC3_TM7_1]HCZ28741.1 hypothetical protein [Candidatus Saccharibacteria bacterium]